MKLFILSLLSSAALAATSSSPAGSSTMNPSMTDMPTMTSSVNNSVVDYSITALPAVMSQPSCVFNCMIPIGLADSSGCDDVTNDCACLSAPVDAVDFLSTCIQTVCKSSTSEYFATASSLYNSYCQSIYGSAALVSAVSANSISDASAAAATSSSASSKTSASAKASSTTSSEGLKLAPAL